MKSSSVNPRAMPHQLTARQRVFGSLVFLLLVNALAFVAYRSLVGYALWANGTRTSEYGQRTTTQPGFT